MTLPSIALPGGRTEACLACNRLAAVWCCAVGVQSLHPLMPLLQPYSDARMRGVIASALLIAFGVFGSLAVGSSLAFGPMLEVSAVGLLCTITT